ncbi:uncharacterized protein FIBRA_01848 [Fibroporia radiculosa]|uniref:REJ domain-containing protein n=1 Tax=Fibroporia radiculosa TaxID=599839 RepID=J4H1H5_9APHY|nr:uncharacterized protein FIBRA_01848 [Fibroporia radiculosa]CCL99824.1 predicted protein [Fibroporia radiculosa]
MLVPAGFVLALATALVGAVPQARTVTSSGFTITLSLVPSMPITEQPLSSSPSGIPTHTNSSPTSGTTTATTVTLPGSAAPTTTLTSALSGTVPPGTASSSTTSIPSSTSPSTTSTSASATTSSSSGVAPTFHVGGQWPMLLGAGAGGALAFLV